MSPAKLLFLLYMVIITWVLFLIVWIARSAILFDAHRHEILTTNSTFVDTEFPQRCRPFNRTFVIEIQNRVNKIMKPWQTVQIFHANVDPGDMMYSKNYRDIMKSKAIKRTDWFEQRVKSCALVGNSGILLNSQCGDVIDDADLIIRMNLAAFGHKYSSAVGSRVSFMTINGLQIKKLVSCVMAFSENRTKNMTTFNNSAKLLTECRTLLDRLKLLKRDSVVMPARGLFQQLVDVLPFLRKRFHINFKVAYNPKDLITVSKGLFHFDSPSTGLALYTAATQLCEDITLFGFYPFYKDSYNRTVLHHYYEPKKRINYTSNSHSMPEEYKLLLELERKGAIRMINNCTSSSMKRNWKILTNQNN